MEIPDCMLEKIRNANREQCEKATWMPDFCPYMRYVCMSNEHVVYALKLLKDVYDTPTLWNEAMRRCERGDVHRDHCALIMQSGPLCQIFPANFWRVWDLMEHVEELVWKHRASWHCVSPGFRVADLLLGLQVFRFGAADLGSIRAWYDSLPASYGTPLDAIMPPGWSMQVQEEDDGKLLPIAHVYCLIGDDLEDIFKNHPRKELMVDPKTDELRQAVLQALHRQQHRLDEGHRRQHRTKMNYVKLY